ncbi:uncharacterized protein LOC119077435 [Bradysia coprophila]|uniref:uncharacterized protein LOC119077435 n=1 Tax=Bradysia coprophila TaxID=38358 RepID=UPI00187DD84C|nr:uncharacterized protein LOC119077435 [Bradysia coprophila]
MLRLLLVITVIGVAHCEDCPIFSALKNDVSLLNKLNGTFYKIFATSVSPVANCQKQTFNNGPNNTLTGYFESPDWCLRLDHCDTSISDYFQCDLTAIGPGTVGTLPSTQRNSIKLVRQIGTGDNICLLYSYCRIGEEGAYVLCQQPPQLLFTLFLEVVQILNTLLGLISKVPPLKIVSQARCDFPNSCPP